MWSAAWESVRGSSAQHEAAQPSNGEWEGTGYFAEGYARDDAASPSHNAFTFCYSIVRHNCVNDLWELECTSNE